MCDELHIRSEEARGVCACEPGGGVALDEPLPPAWSPQLWSGLVVVRRLVCQSAGHELPGSPDDAHSAAPAHGAVRKPGVSAGPARWPLGFPGVQVSRADRFLL